MVVNNLLYIIGNGLDRHYGFITSYCDFDELTKEDWLKLTRINYEVNLS